MKKSGTKRTVGNYQGCPIGKHLVEHTKVKVNVVGVLSYGRAR